MRKRINDTPRKRINEDLPFPKRGGITGRESWHDDEYADKPSPLEERFCQAFLANHRRIETAAILAGISPRRAHQSGRDMLRRPRVKQRIAELEYESLNRLQLDADRLIRTEYMLATTNALDELYTILTPPCRYCHGDNNLYQYTHGELEERLEAYMKLSERQKQKAGPFDPKGGGSYDIEREPDPDCPNCFGRGDIEHPIVVPKPLHEISAQGRMLIAGIKYKDGIPEFQMRDQDGALRAINNGLRVNALMKQVDGGQRIYDITPPGGNATQLKRLARIEHRFVEPTRKRPEPIDAEYSEGDDD